jgi:hypothetical protein
MDLKDAIALLSSDYSAGLGQRIVPNKWAAIALLARIYLYEKNWQNAETESSIIINNTSLFNLEKDPNNVFLANSNEAIWQLQQSNAAFFFTSTPEGSQIIPLDSLTQPFVYLTNTMLNSFEQNDLRRKDWIDSTNYFNTIYYFPYKYKDGYAQAKANGSYKEYYMVLRLAEQYLIRSEARAQLNKLSDAISDLNNIRSRAQLPLLGALNQLDLLAAINHERQVELFCEWGNRWFDLKRSQQATSILSANKGISVTNNSLLYPIPIYELITDPNMSQNPGY